MAHFEEIGFAILSLVRNPLLDLISTLAVSAKSILELSTRLDVIEPGWRDFMLLSADSDVYDMHGVLTASDLSYGLTQEHLDQAELPETTLQYLRSHSTSDIVAHRLELISAQAGLRVSIRDEQQSNQSDEERAMARTCDYGARVQNLVRKVRFRKEILRSTSPIAHA